MSVLYPASFNLPFVDMFDEEIQIHDDAGGHEIGEKHDTVGDVGDEDMVDDET